MDTESVDPRVLRARDLNRQYLGEQRRMDGTLAVEHCERVEARVVKLGAGHLSDEELVVARIVAVLHDFLEDAMDWNDLFAADVFRESIRQEFGERVLALVLTVTLDPRKLWQDQFTEMIARAMATEELIVLIVKAADIEDNAETRHVYDPTFRELWSAYARNMLGVVIPNGLRRLGWQGQFPVDELPDPRGGARTRPPTPPLRTG